MTLPVLGFTFAGSYGHVAIAFTSLATWQSITYGNDARGRFSAVALRLPAGTDVAAVDRGGRHRGRDRRHEAYDGSPGFTAETATMTLIRGFLLVISALIVGAFFTVLTVQRTRQIGLLKAMGASNAYVLRDGLGQMARRGRRRHRGRDRGRRRRSSRSLRHRRRRSSSLPMSIVARAPRLLIVTGMLGSLVPSAASPPSSPPSRSGWRPDDADLTDGPRSAAISLRNLTVTVPDGAGTRALLDRVDLDVAAGEVVVVTGPPGSGKSTLLARRRTAPPARRRAMSSIAGTATAALSRASRARRLRRDHIGIVYQSANLFPSLTAASSSSSSATSAGEPRRDGPALAPTSSWPTSVWPDRADQLPGAAVGRRAPAGRHRPGADGRPDGAAGRRAHRRRSTPPSPPRSRRCSPTEAHEPGVATVIVTHDDAPLAPRRPPPPPRRRASWWTRQSVRSR